MKIDININALKICWPLKVIGAPDIIPWSFKKAIIDPEKVIAPTAAPIDISIKLANFMFPGVPRLKAVGLINAEIATKTAANPTRLWNPATSSGIAVIGILYAMNAPIAPPTSKKTITYTNPNEKLSTDKKVTTTAIIIPVIPKKLPCLEVSGDESPLNAKMNNTPDTK